VSEGPSQFERLWQSFPPTQRLVFAVACVLAGLTVFVLLSIGSTMLFLEVVVPAIQSGQP
jgi:hypothetical protein